MKARGFSLVEVTLALGVAAFCLVVVFGLIPVGLRSNQAAVEQTAAAGFLSSIAADLRATPGTSPAGQKAASQRYAIEIPANPVTTQSVATLFLDENGSWSKTADSKSRYRLTVTFPPNGTDSRRATLAHLKISWPSSAAEPVAYAESFVALDRN
ncbi:Verru_Chthon cassette protein B [Terrimicrobium sacchariphilum]|uniref:Verru_Chthon cassette protein B n=1 Tax=Terrimicrobium sacchariphilum TaxID=690879 RepID=A0A146GC07_TERSA|nr:hypothetical protein [Terrimicrobium sacchariphilum]GAT34702.1 Verru_Chthon cassette protein B [Terrimicrobium sacchariphilum]